MKNIVLITLVLLLSSCCNYDYKISNLKNEKIKFDDLPQAVRDFYINPKRFKKNKHNSWGLICLDQDYKYDIETIKTWYGPWVAYKKLIDLERKISYRITPGAPYPYVIYTNQLYIANKYNVLITTSDYSTLEFTCYALKGK